MKNLIIMIAIIFMSIVLICNNVFADANIIAFTNTKFSVKIPDFADFRKGDYVRIRVNPRTLKNKKIKWKEVNVTPDSNVFFTGYFTNIKKVTTERSDHQGYYDTYYADVEVDELVINGNAYNVKGTLGGTTMENVFTHNYDIIIENDILTSDVKGKYVSKPNGYNKYNTEKTQVANNNQKTNNVQKVNNIAIDETLPRQAMAYCTMCLNRGTYCSTYINYYNKSIAYLKPLINKSNKAKSMYCMLRMYNLEYKARAGIGDPISEMAVLKNECGN